MSKARTIHAWKVAFGIESSVSDELVAKYESYLALRDQATEVGNRRQHLLYSQLAGGVRRTMLVVCPERT